MQNAALKTASVLVAVGVVGFLVVQSGLAGCRSASSEKPPAAASNAVSPGDPGGPSAPSTTPAKTEAPQPTAETPTPTAPPTFLPATKAGPVIPTPQQAPTGKRQ